MAPPIRLPREALADRLAGLSSEAFTSFVAALYRARGWEVERDGRSLHLQSPEHDQEERHVLALVADTEPPPLEPFDHVVTAGETPTKERIADESDVDVSDPDDLHDLLLYGVDRETADALAREHLDRSLEREPSDPLPSSSEGRSGTMSSGSTSGGRSMPAERRGVDAANRPMEGIGAGRREKTTPSNGDETSTGGAPYRRRRLLIGIAILIVGALAIVGASGGLGGTPLAQPGPLTDDGSGGSTPDSPTTSTAAGAIDDRPTVETAAGSGTRTPSASLERRYVGLTPTCERPPELVAVVIVGALRNNDPQTNDGIRTAWNFSSHSRPGATYSRFQEYLTGEEFRPLFDHRRIEISLTYPDPQGRAYLVSVTDPGGEEHAYHLALSKRDFGDREGCWLLAGIVPR